MSKPEKARPVYDDKIKEDSLMDNFCSACSSGDCTGLIPEGADLTEEEFENYKEIYPFAVPDTDDK